MAQVSLKNHLRRTAAFGVTLITLAACGGEPAATSNQSATITAAPAETAEVSTVAPKTLSVAARFAGVTPTLSAEVDDGVRSGFVAMAIQDGETIFSSVNGLADREAGDPMTVDTRFRIASMTKPITSVAILMLADDGVLSIDDPLSKYLPAFAEMTVATSVTANEDGTIPTEALSTPITLRHLLTHTSGLGYLFDTETDLGKLYLSKSLYEMDGDLKTRINTLAALPLYTQPGNKWIYSYATDVLGAVVEIASGQNLEAFFQSRIFTPLGMTDTEFGFDSSDLENVAVVYMHNDAGEIVRLAPGEPALDPNTNGAGWYSGGGGLVSDADDYLAFCQFLINGGVAPDGARLLSTANVDALFNSQIGPAARTDEWREQGVSFSLGGWVALAEPTNLDNNAGAGAFGWGGFYDTSFTINRYEKTAYVAMAQRQPGPHDKQSAVGELMRAALFGDQGAE